MEHVTIDDEEEKSTLSSSKFIELHHSYLLCPASLLPFGNAKVTSLNMLR